MWVEILRPGHHGDTIVRPSGVRECEANLSVMLDAGLKVPGLWRHDRTRLPTGSRPPKREAWGVITDVGRDGDVLAAKFDVPLAADLERVLQLGFMSPSVVKDYRWGGTRFRGHSIAHVSATANPKQREQRGIDMSWCPAEIDSEEGDYSSYIQRLGGW